MSTMHRTYLVLPVAVAAYACGSGPAAPIRDAAFSDVFEVADTIRLEEPDSAPITGIQNLAPGRDGGVLVVDRGRPTVRFHDADGRLIRIVGRWGRGPGELETPTDARLDASGRLYVADSKHDLTTRFAPPDFTYDTSFGSPGSVVYQLDFAEGDLVYRLFTEPRGEQPYNFALTTPAGEWIRGFHPADTIVFSVPYWNSFAGPVGGVGGGRVVTGNMFLYPFHAYAYDGGDLGTFGAPPASWKPPTRPKRGAFVGAGGFDRVRDWLTNMTVVSRLGVLADSLIVAVHAVPDPQTNDFWAQNDYALDVYSIEGDKRWEDVPVPGNVLRVDELLYVLTAQPPDGPWTIVTYRAR